MPNYDGFSDREKGFLNQAFAQMRTASSKAKAALLGGNLTAYRKWFEANGTTQVTKVTNIIKGVDDAILGRPITFAKLDRPGVNVDTSGLCAYVWLIRSGGVTQHVGSGMRILVVWSTHSARSASYLGETMYHELTHKVGSTDDVVYPREQCLQLAKDRPQDAARNAENYNRFLAEFF